MRMFEHVVERQQPAQHHRRRGGPAMPDVVGPRSPHGCAALRTGKCGAGSRPRSGRYGPFRAASVVAANNRPHRTDGRRVTWRAETGWGSRASAG